MRSLCLICLALWIMSLPFLGFISAVRYQYQKARISPDSIQKADVLDRLCFKGATYRIFLKKQQSQIQYRSDFFTLNWVSVSYPPTQIELPRLTAIMESETGFSPTEQAIRPGFLLVPSPPPDFYKVL